MGEGPSLSPPRGPDARCGVGVEGRQGGLFKGMQEGREGRCTHSQLEQTLQP